jgi:hypothetical protein
VLSFLLLEWGRGESTPPPLLLCTAEGTRCVGAGNPPPPLLFLVLSCRRSTGGDSVCRYWIMWPRQVVVECGDQNGGRSGRTSGGVLYYPRTNGRTTRQKNTRYSHAARPSIARELHCYQPSPSLHKTVRQHVYYHLYHSVKYPVYDMNI